MLRWGILGTGFAAAHVLAPAMRACGHDLAVVGSRSLTRAQAFAANHGVRRARGSYAEVLEASDVDAVYVALPNDLHEKWTVGALEAGKHVLCERPLSVDAASAARMAAASARAGRLLMEGFGSRFHARFETTLEMLRSGVIGELRLVHASYCARLRDPRSYRTRAQQGGGALLDGGVHGVAASRWLTGTEPVGVRALQRRWSTGIDGTTAAVLSFPTGVVATVQASFDAGDHDELELVGTDATLRLPRAFTAGRDAEVPLLRDGEAMGAWREDASRRMVEAFTEAAGGAPPVLPVDDAVATAEVLDRIRAEAL